MKEIKILELFGGLKVKVSDDGKVYTFDHNTIRKNGRMDNRKGKQLKPKIDKYGYETIVLTKMEIKEIMMFLTWNGQLKKKIKYINGKMDLLIIIEMN